MKVAYEKLEKDKGVDEKVNILAPHSSNKGSLLAAVWRQDILELSHIDLLEQFKLLSLLGLKVGESRKLSLVRNPVEEMAGG